MYGWDRHQTPNGRQRPTCRDREGVAGMTRGSRGWAFPSCSQSGMNAGYWTPTAANTVRGLRKARRLGVASSPGRRAGMEHVGRNRRGRGHHQHHHHHKHHHHGVKLPAPHHNTPVRSMYPGPALPQGTSSRTRSRQPLWPPSPPTSIEHLAPACEREGAPWGDSRASSTPKGSTRALHERQPAPSPVDSWVQVGVRHGVPCECLRGGVRAPLRLYPVRIMDRGHQCCHWSIWLGVHMPLK